MTRRGFTLLELLIALALVLAIAAIAWPSLARQLDERTFESTVDLVAEQLLLARAHAQATGDPVEVIFFAESRVLQARPFNTDAADLDAVRAIVAGWATLQLPDAISIVFTSPFERVDSTTEATMSESVPDARPQRLVVFAPSGSALLHKAFWLVDESNRVAAIEVQTWTGLARIEISRLPDDIEPGDPDEDSTDEAPLDNRFEDTEENDPDAGGTEVSR